ncbi:MAG: VOC family protein, partial [bacterium]
MPLIERVDRMQLAVHDRAAAEETFQRLFGAERARLDESAHLNAWRTILSIGESELELCEARGPGIVREFLERWGEGLLCAGYASSQIDALAAHLDATGAPYVREGDQLYLPGTTTAGFPMVVSPLAERARVGPVSFFYEATNTLDSDWKTVADLYTRLFQLDAAKFSPIASARFGYEGTLTLFDPPARLDRIELSQTFADRPGAMRRFVEKRGGDSLYMCYLETEDYDALQ